MKTSSQKHRSKERAVDRRARASVKKRVNAKRSTANKKPGVLYGNP